MCVWCVCDLFVDLLPSTSFSTSDGSKNGCVLLLRARDPDDRLATEPGCAVQHVRDYRPAANERELSKSALSLLKSVWVCGTMERPAAAAAMSTKVMLRVSVTVVASFMHIVVLLHGRNGADRQHAGGEARPQAEPARGLLFQRRMPTAYAWKSGTIANVLKEKYWPKSTASMALRHELVCSRASTDCKQSVSCVVLTLYRLTRLIRSPSLVV